MADIVPENKIPDVLRWLELVMIRPGKGALSDQYLIVAWEAARALSFRLSTEQAVQLLGIARNHSFTESHGWGRKAVVTAMAGLLHGIHEYNWTELAQIILPMATTARWEADYDEVLALLMGIAAKSPEARDLVADTLLPRRTPVDTRVAKLARDLGRDIDPGRLRQSLIRTANGLPLQVWSGTDEPPPFQLSNLGSHQQENDGLKVRVILFGGAQELDFVAAHGDRLPDPEKEALLEVVLNLITNPLNLRANRIMLIDFMLAMRDHLTDHQVSSAIACLWHIALGEGLSTTTDRRKSSTTDRMQLTTNSPEELQASAVHAICGLAISAPRIVELSDVLKNALLHAHPIVRGAACLGMIDAFPSDEMGLRLVTMIQDPDENVALRALHAVTTLVERGTLEKLYGLVIVVAERSFASAKPTIRRAVASLSRVLNPQVTDEGAKTTLSAILAAARQDMHYTVRSAADTMQS